MNVNVARYLDLIDTHLLGYLDGEDLSVPAVEHLGRYATALSEDLVTPEHVLEDWEDFYDLADTFVVAYGSPSLNQMDRDAALLDCAWEEPLGALGISDRRFVAQFIYELERYVESRRAGGGPER